MLKLALIGKNISHSKSENIYKKLLKEEFYYDLLDFSSESDLPKLSELQNRYLGISITSPYKKYYLNEVEDLSQTGIINTVRFLGSELEATNTDFHAIHFLLTRYLNSGIKKIHLLGNGAMAQTVLLALEKFPVDLIQYSRKAKNLDKISSGLLDHKALVINTCSRDYVYKGPKDKSYHFWDMNYDFSPHREYFHSSRVNYIDGMEQLYLQASFALKFWKL